MVTALTGIVFSLAQGEFDRSITPLFCHADDAPVLGMFQSLLPREEPKLRAGMRSDAALAPAAARNLRRLNAFDLRIGYSISLTVLNLKPFRYLGRCQLKRTR